MLVNPEKGVNKERKGRGGGTNYPYAGRRRTGKEMLMNNCEEKVKNREKKEERENT